MNFGDFVVLVIAFGTVAVLFGSLLFGDAKDESDDRPEPGRERAITAALDNGPVFRVALGRPGPHRARVEIGGSVYGFATTRDLAEWLTTYGTTVARSGRMFAHQSPEIGGGVEIGHPSLGRR